MEYQWNNTDRGKNQRSWRKPSSISTLCTTNPTRTGLGRKPGLRGDRPATSQVCRPCKYQHGILTCVMRATSLVSRNNSFIITSTLRSPCMWLADSQNTTRNDWVWNVKCTEFRKKFKEDTFMPGSRRKPWCLTEIFVVRPMQRNENLQWGWQQRGLISNYSLSEYTTTAQCM